MAITSHNDVDLLIVGSGPAGSAFARTVFERRPQTRVLMVDVGPKLTDPPGVNTRNIADDRARLVAQVRSEGPSFDEDAVEATADGSPPIGHGPPGTFYVEPEAAAGMLEGRMPAAAISSNVGGMGVHWTCASPEPHETELAPFFDRAEWQEALRDARRLMSVTQGAFAESAECDATVRILSGEFAAELDPERPVQPMPLACRIRADGQRYWTGTDVILASLATEPPETFELRPETLCTSLIVEGEQVIGARMRDVRSGHETTVRARAVVLACDALRTPQLLWASGIRPRALGRHLNEHIQLVAFARLADELVTPSTPGSRDGVTPWAAAGERDPLIGVFWIPYSDRHPGHAQIMQRAIAADASRHPDRGVRATSVEICYFIPQEARPENRVLFSDSEADCYGMPKIRIELMLSDRDRETIDVLRRFQARGVDALGGFAERGEPQLLPPGSSLHYQGTVRMGQQDDGHSVCDAYGRVWGLQNVYLAGNGVTPTSTAGNPTLTAVTHAVRAARRLAASL